MLPWSSPSAQSQVHHFMVTSLCEIFAEVSATKNLWCYLLHIKISQCRKQLLTPILMVGYNPIHKNFTPTVHNKIMPLNCNNVHLALNLGVVHMLLWQVKKAIIPLDQTNFLPYCSAISLGIWLMTF